MLGSLVTAAIDRRGNVWVTNHLDNSARGMFDIVEDIVVLKAGGNADRRMSKQAGADGGSIAFVAARRHAVSRLTFRRLKDLHTHC